MDPRTRLGDTIEGIRMALDQRQAFIRTAFPGIIQSYNPAAMTAVVQPAIMGQIRNPKNGLWTNVPLPLLVDCPVQFPSGGGFTLTFPVNQTDEVLVIIADRCIDNWWALSGTQPIAEFRMHNLSDGFCIPKVWSKPKVLNPAPSSSAVHLRDDGLNRYLELASNGLGLFAGQRLKTKVVSGNYAVTVDDFFIVVTATATITLLASPEPGRAYMIKNTTTSSNVTIVASGTIDGAANLIIGGKGNAHLAYNTVEWGQV